MATSASDWVTEWNAARGAPSVGTAPAAQASDWVNEWNAARSAKPSSAVASQSKSLPYNPYAPEATLAAANSQGAKALGETALSIGTGTAGSIAGGLAGLGDAALRLFDKNAPQPGNVVNKVENAMTYQPRTVAGRSLMGIASLPAQVSNTAGEKVSNAIGSPLVGALTNTGIQALPLLLGSRAPEEAAAPKPSNIPEAVAAARALGLKLTPQEAAMPGGIFGQTLQSLVNGAKLERKVSRANAPRVTAIAARDVGIKGRVTPSSISDAYAVHDAPYKEIEAIPQIKTDTTYQGQVRGQQAPGAKSFPKAQDPRVAALRESYDVPQFSGVDAVAKIRELRQEGQARAYGGKYDPAEKAYGKAQLLIAKSLEEQIDRHLNESGGSDLVSRYQAARQAKAKLASFERAWKAGNEQQVSAANLGKQLGKNVPLSGNTRVIAQSAREFPRAFQDISKLRNEGPLSNLDFKLEGGLGAVKPVAAAKAAPFFLAAPLARAFLASDLYQRMAFGPHAPKAAPSFPGLLKTAPALPIMGGAQSPSSWATLLAGR